MAVDALDDTRDPRATEVKKLHVREATDPERPAGVDQVWCSVEVDFALDRLRSSGSSCA
jgi:hypothetical protein